MRCVAIYPQNCLSLAANTNQEVPQLAQSVVSSNYKHEFVSFWLNSNKIFALFMMSLPQLFEKEHIFRITYKIF